MFFWLARSRRHGVPFDSAWKGALRNVRWPHDKNHRDEWKRVVSWSEPAFRESYCRESTRGVDESMRELRGDIAMLPEEDLLDRPAA